MEATTRERINVLAADQEAAELDRIEGDLGLRLDDVTARLLQIQLRLQASELSVQEMLSLMEERQALGEDRNLAKESLAYLRFRRKQEQERRLRGMLKELAPESEPSIYRKELIEYLLRHNEVTEMQHLLNSLIEKRTKIIADRETLEGALQHVSVASFELMEAALSMADDVLAGIDTDITVLWNGLHRGL